MTKEFIPPVNPSWTANGARNVLPGNGFEAPRRAQPIAPQSTTVMHPAPSETICVDLNGVLDTYHGWQGEVTWHPPRAGAADFLRQLRERGFRVVVLTARDVAEATRWLETHGLIDLIEEVTNRKPAALAYVDDRAICFRGDFDETLAVLHTFAPHWQTASPASPEG